MQTWAVPHPAALKKTVVDGARRGLDVVTLFDTVTAVLRPAIGFHAYCWETLDPVSLLPTSGVTENLPRESAGAYFENEYRQDDVNKFEDLLAEGVASRSLFAATGGQPQRSRRYRDIYAPNGFGDELRTVLSDGDECWGAVSFLRRAADEPFDEADTVFMAGVSQHLGAAIRTAVVLRASDRGGEGGPGVAVIDSGGRLVSTTTAADQWLGLLDDSRHGAGRRRLPVAVESVLAQLDRPDCPAPRARVQAADGTWLVVHGAELHGDMSGQRVVVIEPVAPRELAGVIVRAYGLSPRERQVAELVLRGLATKAVARALDLSPHTVTDYLRSLFEKVGVRSRRELAARLLVEHYLPRMMSGTEIAATGWFVDAT